MNPFIKTNKPWLGLLGLAVIVVFLAFVFRPKSPEYHTEANQALKMMIDSQNQVAISDLASAQLIDIRTTELFAQGHAENAISIPVRNLLDNESLELFNRLLKNGQTAVLYGSDELQTVAPCLLLQQMGYTNVKTLEGRYVATNELKKPALPATEVMLLDTATMKAKQEIKVSQPEKKKPQVVIPVRKEATSGGGC